VNQVECLQESDHSDCKDKRKAANLLQRVIQLVANAAQ